MMNGSTSYQKQLNVPCQPKPLLLLITPELMMRNRLSALRQQGKSATAKLVMLRKFEYAQELKLEKIKLEFKRIDRKLAMLDGRFSLIQRAVRKTSGKIGPIKTTTSIAKLSGAIKKMSAQDREELLAEIKGA